MLLSILLLAPAGTLSAQENPERGPGWVDYYRQEVTITCNDTVAVIEGRYYLRNLIEGMITIGIQYPFMVDRFHPFPHRIAVSSTWF